MIEKHLKPFIDVTVNYFQKITSSGAEVKAPLIQFQQSALLDYTGIIEISGQITGCVYITAPKAMLEELVTILGEEEKTKDNLSDLIGEIANIISSNVRRDFGPKFHVSVPQVTHAGERFPVALPPVFFVLPIVWKSYQFFLVIAFNEAETALGLSS